MTAPRTSTWALALLVLAGRGAAQERQHPAITPPRGAAEREMVELFGKVERTLGEIDRLLQDASSTPRAPAGAQGALAEKLQNAQARGREVKEGIDRILELARQMTPPSSGGGGGQQQDPQPSSGSPLDQQGEQSTGREQTPSTPESGGEPQQPGGKPDGQKPDQQPGGKKPGGREKPDSPQGSKDPAHQQPGGPPRAGPQGDGQRAVDEHDRWGDLPVHARDVFRNEGGRDMPPLYREWIDSYYRRLNKKP